MRMNPSLLALACLAASAVGCSDDPAPAGNAASDASTDAGSADAAPFDSGVIIADGGAADTGPMVQDDCNPVTQADCVAPNSKCVVESSVPNGGTECVTPDPTDNTLGETCSGRTCQAGLTCVNSGMGPICRQVCDRTDGSGCTSLGADFDCREQLRGTNWGVCGELPAECNAFTNMPCAANEACRPLRRRTGVFELRCGPAGAGVHGDTCDDAANRCSAGHVCVRLGTTGRIECRKVCQGNPDCTMGAGAMSECSGTIMGVAAQYCNP